MIAKTKFYQPIIKMFGGKGGRQINKWIISNFPANYQNLHYLEGCVGGGSIFVNKLSPTIGRHEQINDLNKSVIHLYRFLRDDCELLVNSLSQLEYSDITFQASISDNYYNIDDDLNWAVKTYIKYRMSRAGMGKDFCWSNRTRGGQPEALNSWGNSIKQLPDISRRLQKTRITSQDILRLLDSRRSRSDLFIYLDPPYVKTTRSSPNIYQCEFSNQQHAEMLEIITAGDFLPYILLSGYDNELYQQKLTPNLFEKRQLEVANHSAQNSNKKRKVECIWRNY